MPKPDKNDIERLSRGESTRGKIGNRGVGHRLTQKSSKPGAGVRPSYASILRLGRVGTASRHRGLTPPPSQKKNSADRNPRAAEPREQDLRA